MSALRPLQSRRGRRPAAGADRVPRTAPDGVDQQAYDLLRNLLGNRVPLLLFLAQEGPVPARVIAREFPAVDVGEVYRTLKSLARWRWVRLVVQGAKAPYLFALESGAAGAALELLDELRGDTHAASEFDEVEFEAEVRALLMRVPHTRPAHGGPSQIRLVLNVLNRSEVTP